MKKSTLNNNVGILTSPECKNPINTGINATKPNTNKIADTIEKNANGL